MKEARAEDPRFGLVDNGVEYDSVIGFSNIGPRMFALSLHPNPHAGLYIICSTLLPAASSFEE